MRERALPPDLSIGDLQFSIRVMRHGIWSCRNEIANQELNPSQADHIAN
jgi:hypothetical protein